MNRERVRISEIRPAVTSGDELLVARVVSKSARRQSQWGREFFKVILADPTGEIDLCVFEESMDLYDQIEVDEAYYFTGLQVHERTTTENATGLTHPAQLTTDANRTHVEPYGVPPVQLYSFNPPPIAEILTKRQGRAVDVIGICTAIHLVELKYRYVTQEPFRMRNIDLEDETGRVRLALFEDEAFFFSNRNEGKVLAMKGAITTSCGPDGYLSLQATATSRLHLQPITGQADALMEWYGRIRPGPEGEPAVADVG